ncbi:hypothetical protein LTR86_007157 [Recurvomyces mirabilis]|nr:hypothetical protein LTR86_007157 [Recurvomyces mirabilis]
MHSPLPDSSALEAGLVEDERATRLSRVQYNVRNLLRNSMIGSVRSSFARISPLQARTTVEDSTRSPLQSPLRPSPPHEHIQIAHDVLASPSSPACRSDSDSDSPTPIHEHDLERGLFPPISYQDQMTHQSNLFNTRAVAALDHPDLTDPSLAILIQQKTEDRHKRAWKRSRNRKMRYASARRSKASIALCVAAGLLLAGIVATYLAFATSQPMTSTFHILFILAILLATIVFIHAVVRICLFRPSIQPSPRLYVVADGRPKRRRRHRHHHHHHHERQIPGLSDTTEDFVPTIPIPVHLAADDEVRPDSREAEPSVSANRASRIILAEGEFTTKNLDPELPKPPPAYGRWRGSVRADPELLHWCAIPSPVDANIPAMPSPTYEEAMAAATAAAGVGSGDEQESRTGPPSYVTRESPARRRDDDVVHEARVVELAQAQWIEPEMIQGIGIGRAS